MRCDDMCSFDSSDLDGSSKSNFDNWICCFGFMMWVVDFGQCARIKSRFSIYTHAHTHIHTLTRTTLTLFTLNWTIFLAIEFRSVFLIYFFSIFSELIEVFDESVPLSIRRNLSRWFSLNTLQIAVSFHLDFSSRSTNNQLIFVQFSSHWTDYGLVRLSF